MLLVQHFDTLFVWILPDKSLLLYPMKRRRYIAWFLMWVCMIMLTAAVLPHHHHHDILCLQQDVCTCHCTLHHHQTHSDQSSDAQHTCDDGCVTKFKSITPDKAQDSVSSPYAVCQLLYAVADVLILSWKLPEQRVPLYTYYLEKLHSICLPAAQGLRAPPVVA